MKVTIVAKTRHGVNVCVGAVADNGKSVRLMDATGGFPNASTYSIGEEWEVKVIRPTETRAPHLEDVWVQTQKLVGNKANLKTYIPSIAKPWTGGVDSLFDGKLGFTGRGRGYIEEPDVPDRSTWFWTPSANLKHEVVDKAPYYTCGGRQIKYVGVEPPLPAIQKGTLVRVSLARWWKQDGASDNLAERCYLQISGWYL